MCVLLSGQLNLLTLYFAPILMTSIHQITNKVSPLIFSQMKNQIQEGMSDRYVSTDKSPTILELVF